ncbi:DUF2184 domain-containing protein [Escherichia coli]|nr:DUF2184 domain-containing protein [Escherichia coli]
MGVVKLADYRPQLEVVEHRVADTENGFMRVANEITDSLLMADLTVRQLKVMLAIMRKTYGFNKPMDRLTNTQIAAMTGIHHTHVCAAKRQLIERKFLIADGVKIRVNKVVSQWISQDSLTLAKTANKTLAKSANGYKPSQLNTKDNIQKTINTNTPLPPNQSLLTYLQTNTISYHQNGVPLNIRAVKWLKGRGVGKKDRMVAYTNDKKYVRYPLVPLQSVPVQYRGLYQIVTYYGKLGAVEPVYKETISYVDGI